MGGGVSEANVTPCETGPSAPDLPFTSLLLRYRLAVEYTDGGGGAAEWLRFAHQCGGEAGHGGVAGIGQVQACPTGRRSARHSPR
jgi:hypothetical protein